MVKLLRAPFVVLFWLIQKVLFLFYETLWRLVVITQLALIALYSAMWGILALPLHLAVLVGIILLRIAHLAAFLAFLLSAPVLLLFFPAPHLTSRRVPRFRFYWREDQPLHDYAYSLMLYLHRDPEVAAERELLG